MKKKTTAVKNARKLVKSKLTAGAGIVKEEGGEIMVKVKGIAAAANRKGRAAIHAIKIS
jgi:NaMN:DMB phosphoribosyltransferase